MDDVRVAERLLTAIRRRDWEAIGGCFAEDAVLRVLTPHRLRVEAGRDAIVARYRAWLGLEECEVVSASAEVVADRVRVVYRFRGLDPAKGPQLNEHTGYGAVDDGALAFLNVSCAGFRPDPGARERS